MKITLTEVSAIVSRANRATDKANKAIEQFKRENPGADMEVILTGQRELSQVLGRISNSELDKFVSHAKEQGVKMSFDSMEMGVLAAGRKDMQNGLAEILNTLEFDRPVCAECDEKMVNRGRNKKK
jgi:predicted peroxiredoxin